MRALLAIAACCTAVGLAGCTNKLCTAIFISGLNITVKDRAGSAICDATVTAVDGSHTETLTPGDCTYHGAGERPGDYTVTASKVGFQDKRIDVSVGADECHVTPESREIVLDP